MNHPKPEDWVPYLFGDTEPEQRRQLKLHLEACPECRDQVATWQRTRGQLDAWKVRTARRVTLHLQPFVAWAAAAALILALGFLIGRVTTGRADIQTLQAALEPRLREQLRQELVKTLRQEQDLSASVTLANARLQAQQLVADYDQSLTASRSAEIRAIYGALEKLSANHLSDFISLKKDVDTVAVMTDAGLRRTERQLVQFVDYNRPAQPAEPRPQ